MVPVFLNRDRQDEAAKKAAVCGVKLLGVTNRRWFGVAALSNFEPCPATPGNWRGRVAQTICLRVSENSVAVRFVRPSFDARQDDTGTLLTISIARFFHSFLCDSFASNAQPIDAGWFSFVLIVSHGSQHRTTAASGDFCRVRSSVWSRLVGL